jgi:membrane fusion protein (multidrug efflux system)
MSIRAVAILLVTVLVLGGGGYYWYQHRTSRAPAPPAAPPPEVGVIELRAEEIPLPLSYAGRVVGLRDVEVRAQVGGILLKREFTEGETVEQGKVLFRIDPRPYQAALDRANAQRAQAQATLRQAEENFARIEELARRQVATEKQLEDARAARAQAQAAIQLAEAEIRAAELNLGYTTVTAPVAGTTSLQSPPEGATVVAQQTVLTTITPHDPAYVSFSVTDEELRQYQALNRARDRPLKPEELEVELRFGDQSTYPQTGRINVSGATVDPNTGTIQIRAVFPNPERALLSGQFVRLAIKGVTLQNAIAVPKRAVSQGPQGPFVYALAGNNSVEVRPVRLGQELSDVWVIREGLQAGERVVVDGVIRVRPGATVRPVPIAAAPQAAQTAAPAAGARP